MYQVESEHFYHTLDDTDLLCVSADVNVHRRLILEDTSEASKCKQQLYKLCKDYLDIVFTHSNDIGYTTLIKMCARAQLISQLVDTR